MARRRMGCAWAGDAMDSPGAGSDDGSYGVPACTSRDETRGVPDAALLYGEIAHLLEQRDAALAQTARDPASGLPNRAYFSQELEQLAARCLAAENSAVVMVVGVERLAILRESLGYAIADEVTHRIADRLRDAIPPSTLLARAGDNSFVVALAVPAGRSPGQTDPATLADRLIAVIDSPIRVGEDDLRLLASIGIARFPEDSMHSDLLLAHAHAAMRHARDHGARAYQFYTPAIGYQGARRLRLEAELHRGLDRGEFCVHYQPRRALLERRIIGVEALLRWDHPEKGLLAAADFIDVAVDTGLITPIGESVLRQACRDAMQWPADIALSVNLCAREFRGNRIENIIDDALVESGLPVRRFHLELTEASLRGSGSQSADETDVSLVRLTALRERGLKIVLDNFGMAVSGPDLLRRCRADFVKIDARLIRALDDDPDVRVVVRSIATLARHFGATVIGEGIEDATQAVAALHAGCTEGQGFYLGRPMTAGRLIKLLQTASGQPV
jgi:diguanylate cyclase (GGDEF)-like protein